jgi:hypothetical protein
MSVKEGQSGKKRSVRIREKNVWKKSGAKKVRSPKKNIPVRKQYLFMRVRCSSLAYFLHAHCVVP